MPKKRIDISVYPNTDPIGGMAYMAKARDETGREVAYAYGRDSRDAKAKVVQKVRSMYGWEAEILY